MNRRRLLQIFAAAPFVPWEEILREFAKPQIFYSIPAAPQTLIEAAVEAIELETWANQIPDLLFQKHSIYERIRGKGPGRVFSRSPFRVPMQRDIVLA